jgi:hypothetical protein
MLHATSLPTLQDYVIKSHADDQYLNRGGKSNLREELKSATPFGSQWRKGFLLLLPGGLVAAGEAEDGKYVITTVLTKDFAIANMQAGGVRFAAMPVSNPTNPIEARAELRKMDAIAAAVAARVKREAATRDDIPKVDIINIAVQHAINSTKKNDRKADLFKIGIKSLESTAADKYRVAFASAKLMIDSIRAYFRQNAMESVSAYSIDEMGLKIEEFYRKFDTLKIKVWRHNPRSAEDSGGESHPESEDEQDFIAAG